MNKWKMSEKTHEPSDQKLKDARKKGQIPRSKLFSSAFVTTFGLVGTLSSASTTSLKIKAFTLEILILQSTPSTALWSALSTLSMCVLPTIIGATLGALLSSLYTSGLEFNADAVSFKLDSLNVAEGFKKLFSLKTIIDVFKGLVVAMVIGIIFYDFIKSNGPIAFSAISHSGVNAFAALFQLLSGIVLRAAFVLVLLGVGDQFLAKKKHIKELMMSHEEVKQEHKNSEGDPHTKSKRKSLQKQMASGGKGRGVKKATAIVVNPTHIAIALRYDESECEAPYIVAKGREMDALQIRREANELNIPIIKDIHLARSLIHHDVGEEIPEELYQAAAAILKVALEAKNSNQENQTPALERIKL
jgi:type III secretion protein U